MNVMRGIFKLTERVLLTGRTAEASDNLARMELDEKLVFKANSKVELGLKDPNRKVLHRGDVSRKSDNKLEWLDIHLILLDNFLIMAKRRRERGVERFIVSKQVTSAHSLF
jgi:hypothetical protein